MYLLNPADKHVGVCVAIRHLSITGNDQGYRAKYSELHSICCTSVSFTSCLCWTVYHAGLLFINLHTPKLLKLFHAKGGALGQRLKILMEPLENTACPTVETAREVVLRCLIEYLGEHGEHLIKEFSGTENLEELEELVVAITVITKDIASTSDSPKEIGVVIEGVEVIKGLGDIARACCLLLGLTYTLNLDYPKQLKYTFEVFRKLFLELDASKLSTKVQSFKSKLLA